MSIFAAVVDGGSLSAAGRRLGMPLATVSRKLSELEARLGTRLLSRSTRRLELTEEGRDYLAACRRILEQVDEAERVAAGAYRTVTGQLTIAAPIVFGRLHVAPVVCAFLEQHAAVDVDLQLGDRNVDLIEEHVDVALRIGLLPDSALIATQVGEVRRIVCASPVYLAAHGTPDSIDALADHRCISFASLDGADTWVFTRDRAAARHVRVRTRLNVNTADAAIAAALDGFGLTRVLDYQVADALREGRLVRVLPDEASPPVPVHLLYSPQGRLPMKTRAFLDFAAPRIRERLRE